MKSSITTQSCETLCSVVDCTTKTDFSCVNCYLSVFIVLQYCFVKYSDLSLID